jgi:hypothetical protein
MMKFHHLQPLSYYCKNILNKLFSGFKSTAAASFFRNRFDTLKNASQRF